jgi:hypothetical protein
MSLEAWLDDALLLDCAVVAPLAEDVLFSDAFVVGVLEAVSLTLVFVGSAEVLLRPSAAAVALAAALEEAAAEAGAGAPAFISTFSFTPVFSVS